MKWVYSIISEKKANQRDSNCVNVHFTFFDGHF